jgi:hypothetical protein
MSAWMTSNVHRSALTQAALVNGIIDSYTQAEELFDELTRCNRLALHYRYGDQHPDQMPPEQRSIVEAPLDPNVIIFNISCWSYQCSEYNLFGDEPAEKMMQQLKHKLLTDLGFAGDEDGWRDWYFTIRKHTDMPWGIDKWEDVIQQASERTA